MGWKVYGFVHQKGAKRLKMNQYEIHFKVSGRPFLCKVSAGSREDAEDLIREAVVITEIKLLRGEESKPSNAAEGFAGLNDLMNVLGIK